MEKKILFLVCKVQYLANVGDGNLEPLLICCTMEDAHDYVNKLTTEYLSLCDKLNYRIAFIIKDLLLV